MSDDDVMLCVDRSNNFNKIFLPLCREFKARIIQVGLKCDVTWGDVETSARKVVFGAHSSPEYWLKKAHTNDIIVNLEPFYKAEWRDKNINYLKLLQSRCVFEYCHLNLPYLNDGHFFKLPPLYSDLQPTAKKEIDIVFIGSQNQFRNNMLNEIASEGLNLKVGFNILDNDTFHVFDRSWIYLNLNLDEQSVFNDYRFMSCAMTNTLFAGHSGDITNHPEVEKLIGVSIFENDADMVIGLKDIINNKAKLLRAFATQYEIAQENKTHFNDFVKFHFN
mgnify:FL=1